jgi:hypothetical protein
VSNLQSHGVDGSRFAIVFSDTEMVKSLTECVPEDFSIDNEGSQNRERYFKRQRGIAKNKAKLIAAAAALYGTGKQTAGGKGSLKKAARKRVTLRTIQQEVPNLPPLRTSHSETMTTLETENKFKAAKRRKRLHAAINAVGRTFASCNLELPLGKERSEVYAETRSRRCRNSADQKCTGEDATLTRLLQEQFETSCQVSSSNTKLRN